MRAGLQSGTMNEAAGGRETWADGQRSPSPSLSLSLSLSPVVYPVLCLSMSFKQKLQPVSTLW